MFNIKTIYVCYDKTIGVPIPFKHKNKQYLSDCLNFPADTYGNRLINDLIKISEIIKSDDFFRIPACFYDENLNKVQDFIIKQRKLGNDRYENRSFSYEFNIIRVGK